jgi:hypothetical protein
LAIKAPSSIILGKSTTIEFDLSNKGTTDASSVVLNAELTGLGKVTDLVVSSSSGACSADSGLKCILGTIEAGKSISVQFSASAVGKTVTLKGNVASAGCEKNEADNTATQSVTVMAEASDAGGEASVEASTGPSLDSYDAEGGCSCELSGKRASGARGLGIVLLGLLLGKLRKNREGASLALERR